MSLQATALKRVFKYSGMTLPDPGAEMTPTQVRDMYAAHSYGELTSAAIDGPKIVDDTATYEFVRAVKDKG